MISAWRADQIGILTLAVPVPRPHHRRAISISKRKWLSIISHGVDLVVIWITMAWRKGWVVGDGFLRNRLLVEWLTCWNTQKLLKIVLETSIWSRCSACDLDKYQVHQVKELHVEKRTGYTTGSKEREA